MKFHQKINIIIIFVLTIKVSYSVIFNLKAIAHHLSQLLTQTTELWRSLKTRRFTSIIIQKKMLQFSFLDLLDFSVCITNRNFGF